MKGRGSKSNGAPPLGGKRFSRDEDSAAAAYVVTDANAMPCLQHFRACIVRQTSCLTLCPEDSGPTPAQAAAESGGGICWIAAASGLGGGISPRFNQSTFLGTPFFRVMFSFSMTCGLRACR